jgi:hypothetical protein
MLMAEIDLRVLASGSAAGAAAQRRTRRTFYVVLAVFMTVLVGVGFWPSYYGPLVRGAAQAPVVLHIHGVIFIGWMALLISQTTLAARGKLRAHRALGSIGIGYGVVLWLLGLLVSFVAPVMHVNAGEWTVDEAATFLPIPLGDMVLFGGFFAAAVAYRDKSEIHKRLMVMATIAVVFAAAFRLQNAGVPMSWAIVVWYVPLVIAMAYDLYSRGRIHAVYWIGAGVMAIALLRLPFALGTTELWLGIGRPIIESLT